MGYKKEALKGVGWVGSLRGVTRVVSFLKTIIIARILAPEDVGLYAIAFFMLALMEVLTETGINVVLLQKKEEVDDYISTAWIISMARAFVIAAFLFLSAPFISLFFKMPEAAGLIRLIALVPFLRGFINPSIILFQKRLQFGRDFWFRFIIFAFDAMVAISATLILKNPYGLIIGLIFGVILEIILSFVMIKPWPTLTFNKDKAREVVNRGKWMTGAGIFQYLFREGDDAVVGRLLGGASLGYYQMAYKIATLPISEVADVFAKVTLPVYVKIADDKKRLKKAFWQTTLVVTLFSTLFGLFLIIFAKPLVHLVLGEKWLPAVPALRIVSVYAILRAITQPAFTLLLALNKQERVTAITFVGIASMFICIIPLTNSFGIVGTGISTIVGILSMLPFVIYYIFKLE